MKSRNHNLLSDIYDNLVIIEELLQGIGFEDYRTNRKIKIDVMRTIEHILELNHQIDPEFKSQHSEIHWSAADFLKDQFIDANSGIKDDAVWKLCKHSFRQFKKSIDAVLTNID